MRKNQTKKDNLSRDSLRKISGGKGLPPVACEILCPPGPVYQYSNCRYGTCTYEVVNQQVYQWCIDNTTEQVVGCSSGGGIS